MRQDPAAICGCGGLLTRRLAWLSSSQSLVDPREGAGRVDQSRKSALRAVRRHPGPGVRVELDELAAEQTCCSFATWMVLEVRSLFPVRDVAGGPAGGGSADRSGDCPRLHPSGVGEVARCRVDGRVAGARRDVARGPLAGLHVARGESHSRAVAARARAVSRPTPEVAALTSAVRPVRSVPATTRSAGLGECSCAVADEGMATRSSTGPAPPASRGFAPDEPDPGALPL